MAWNTDQPPLNYLQRRVIYYKKKRGKTQGMISAKHLLARYGKVILKRIIANKILEIDERIKEFEEAIKLLNNFYK